MRTERRESNEQLPAGLLVLLQQRLEARVVAEGVSQLTPPVVAATRLAILPGAFNATPRAFEGRRVYLIPPYPPRERGGPRRNRPYVPRSWFRRSDTRASSNMSDLDPFVRLITADGANAGWTEQQARLRKGWNTANYHG